MVAGVESEGGAMVAGFEIGGESRWWPASKAEGRRDLRRLVGGSSIYESRWFLCGGKVAARSHRERNGDEDAAAARTRDLWRWTESRSARMEGRRADLWRWMEDSRKEATAKVTFRVYSSLLLSFFIHLHISESEFLNLIFLSL
ncbi:hypothetical protein LR48_Vigan04g055200 [Vigna angularis]|uniref:Uncharacterized protein n=1 Tax=Phaseolus angularis TaxID=3914 RepID=A0A0L9UCV3_PHAAN|nr:hypothetical protein LR48_Vigan04g055200 [Vigna angularis]